MQKINGISRSIVDRLLERTNSLSQGRNAGCIGLINKDRIIDSVTPIVDGGISGLPLRQLLNKVINLSGRPILEGINALPEDDAVLITTRPGKSGLITDVSAVDFFNLPIVSIGIKMGKVAGVGILYPETRFFDLGTESEAVDLDILAAKDMEEEREILRRSTELSLEFLDIAQPLPVVDVPERSWQFRGENELSLPRLTVNSLDKALAEEMVARSVQVGQGREVAMVARIDKDGKVRAYGQVVAGGMGYVPSRILASSAVELKGTSLREAYVHHIPPEAIIVHTHPGATGVMHVGDATAGPGTWGRPIIAIGHDREGKVRGATVVEVTDKLFELADEDEKLGLDFFTADTPEEEADIRNRKFGIAQEYTSLCKPIEIN
ncbi:MAG TPA: peptidase S7 [Bacillota bacterium]|nr:peptidase S7 [Bacillota bacterium]